ncbi:TPA: LysR substrate-binding domain-containing protein [Klebsiella pneumoniae]
MAFQIKFHQIRAFVEVAREGSIRGASRALAVSQPALTKAIKELEEGLSAQLFVRRSQGVALTDNGESFYQHASLILEELRAAQDELLQRQGELDFTINTYYPGPYDHEFSFEKLFEKPFAVFARAGHPAAQATSLGELMDHHWTMPTPRGSYFKQLQECFEQLGREPKVGIVCETFSSCISLVVKSDFLSILPVELGNDPLMADKLVMIPIREVLPTATYYLIQRRDTRQTPLTASLITLFRRQSRQLFP